MIEVTLGVSAYIREVVTTGDLNGIYWETPLRELRSDLDLMANFDDDGNDPINFPMYTEDAKRQDLLDDARQGRDPRPDQDDDERRSDFIMTGIDTIHGSTRTDLNPGGRVGDASQRIEG